MILLDHLSGTYSQADADIMNAAVHDAVVYFDVDTADLSDRERLMILDEIETTVVSNFFNGRVLYRTQDLLPENFQRFLASRVNR